VAGFFRAPIRQTKRNAEHIYAPPQASPLATMVAFRRPLCLTKTTERRIWSTFFAGLRTDTSKPPQKIAVFLLRGENLPPLLPSSNRYPITPFCFLAPRIGRPTSVCVCVALTTGLRPRCVSPSFMARKLSLTVGADQAHAVSFVWHSFWVTGGLTSVRQTVTGLAQTAAT